METKDLKSLVRAVTEEDRKKLPTFSYSKLDVKKNCPYKYDLKYNQKNFSSKGSIATDVGTLIHWCLEQKALAKLKNVPVSYEDIAMCVRTGVDSTSPKGKNSRIYGIEELIELYPEEFYSPDKITGKNYKEKIEDFLTNVLPERMEDVNSWAVWGAEVPFEFVYDNKCILHGFIDRIDVSLNNEGKPIIRITDYKTSKKVYPDKKIKTPMQMVVYDLACLYMFGQRPTSHVYDFVLIDEKQSEPEGVCSFGYFNRGIKQLNSLLDDIKTKEEPENEEIAYTPKPSPLCFYCEFCTNNPNGETKYKNLCPYYSLWTPTEKSYEVNMKFVPGVKPRTLAFDF